MKPESEELASFLAGALMQHVPPLIRRRLDASSEWGEVLGLRSERVLTFNQEVAVRQDSLLRAAELALKEERDEVVDDASGGSLSVCPRSDGVKVEVVSRTGEVSNFPMHPLGLLSPAAKVRLKVLERLASLVGGYELDLSDLREVIRLRPLRYSEVAEVLLAEQFGVITRLERLKARLVVGELRLAELVPSELSYFQAICGPKPTSVLPDAYLLESLPAYRKELIRRDLGTGLRVALAGFLLDDLSPASLLDEVDDDQLSKVIAKVSEVYDPFSLLGLVDVGLRRQGDHYTRIANVALDRLLAPEFRLSEGMNMWELLSVLIDHVGNHIVSVEEMAIQPPFWKRLASWTHAALLLNVMHDQELDLEALKEQVRRNRSLAGTLSRQVDLQREPLVAASMVAPELLRAEVLGRLLELKRRHEAEGRSVPRADDIESLLSNGWISAFPGPLEGHRTPTYLGRVAEVEEQERLVSLSPEAFWESVLPYSQKYSLGEVGRERVISLITSATPADSAVDLAERLRIAAIVAAAERDVRLADHIAEQAIGYARGLREDEQRQVMVDLCDLLVVAGAAIADRGEWVAWLSGRILKLANVVHHGQCCNVLAFCLRNLRIVIGPEMGVVDRAEALAVAGSMLEMKTVNQESV